MGKKSGVGGQGALQYLLLIGGAVAVAALVVSALMNVSISGSSGKPSAVAGNMCTKAALVDQCKNCQYTGAPNCTTARTLKIGAAEFTCTGPYPNCIAEQCVSGSLCTSFTYSGFGPCVSGSQSRTLLSSSPCGCTGGTPALTQACSTNPPSVSLASPANNSNHLVSTGIPINATASDADGTITKVEFYQDAALLGTDLTSPYSLTWLPIVEGTYSLTAKAYDDGANVATSGAVTVNVLSNMPPTVSITLPAEGANYYAPASVIITAAASDSGGTISKVEFYADSTLLSTDTVSPYVFVWIVASEGDYQINAIAYDNGGASATSGYRNITVNESLCGTPSEECDPSLFPMSCSEWSGECWGGGVSCDDGCRLDSSSCTCA